MKFRFVFSLNDSEDNKQYRVTDALYTILILNFAAKS